MVYTLDLTLTLDDVSSYEFEQSLADTVETYELQGITAGASGNISVYSRSPSNAPGGGLNYVVQAQVNPDDQTQANAWAGLFYAKEENIFFDADGIKHRGGLLTLRCFGQYNVLDFSAVYVKFNVQGKRVDFDEFLFYLKGYGWEFDPTNGLAVTTFYWQAATAAPAGATYTRTAEPTS